MGILALISAPIVGRLVETYRLPADRLGRHPRSRTMSAWRTWFNGDATFLDMAWLTLATGPMVMFSFP